MEEFNEWLMNDYFAPDELRPYVLDKLLKQGNLSGDEENWWSGESQRQNQFIWLHSLKKELALSCGMYLIMKKCLFTIL